MKYLVYTLIIVLFVLGGVFTLHVSAQTPANGGLAGTPASGVPASSAKSGASAQSDDPAREVLFLLNKLSGIVIKTDIFQSKAFISLRDFGLNVSPEPYGRPNPFAPLGDNTPVPTVSPSPSVSAGGTGAGSGGATRTPTPRATPTPAPAPSSGFDDLNDGFFDSEL